jgi:uncharacterized membrane protein YphA (DoxX/SURF4 family)
MTNLPIPIQVLYAGLAGTLLALLVAMIQNRWSLRVFFILALRLAIGWHFLFEGLHKVHSHYVGPTETNRPFSSEPYFREAEGPLGPYMRKQIGDPEELLKQKTYPASMPETFAKIDNPNLRLAVAKMEAERLAVAKNAGDKGAVEAERAADAEFAKAVPEAVRKEWDGFTSAFVEKYKLSDAEKAKLTGDMTTAAMAKYGRWVTGAEPHDSKVKFVSGDTPLTAPQRLEYIRHRKTDLEEAQKRQAAELGQSYGTDGARVKEAKAAVAAARTILIADADAFLNDLKKDAFTTVINARLDRNPMGPQETLLPPSKYVGKDDARLNALITPDAQNPDPFLSLPAPLRDGWAFYHGIFKEAYGVSDKTAADVDAAYAGAKLRLASWYFDRDEFTGQPKPGFGKLVKDYKEKQQKAATNPKDGTAEVEAGLARAALLTALDAKYADLKTLLAAALPTEVAEGVHDPARKVEKGSLDPPEPKETFIQKLDVRTQWVLVAVGACLLAGLFTPIACLVGAAFLVLTYLAHPPFPWLPLPPGTEGNPVFINKNVIEFLALMVILVHPTGRWMGLDAILHRMIFRDAPDPK